MKDQEKGGRNRRQPGSTYVAAAHWTGLDPAKMRELRKNITKSDISRKNLASVSGKIP